MPTSSPPVRGCTPTGPGRVASRGVVHGVGGPADPKRSAEAYGTPRQLRTPSARRPATGPAVVLTTRDTGCLQDADTLRAPAGRPGPAGCSGVRELAGELLPRLAAQQGGRDVRG